MESGGGDLPTHLFVPSCRRSLLKTETLFFLSLHIFFEWCEASDEGQYNREFLFFPPSPNTSPGVGNIFRLSPPWLCVYGVVLTKKDLVQPLSVCLKAGLCDVAVSQGSASKPCILYLCNVASIKRLLYCLFLWLPVSDAVGRKVAPHANECHCSLSRFTAACVMKYSAATGVTWLLVCELGPLSQVFRSSVDRVDWNFSKNF